MNHCHVTVRPNLFSFGRFCCKFCFGDNLIWTLDGAVAQAVLPFGRTVDANRSVLEDPISSFTIAQLFPFFVNSDLVCLVAALACLIRIWYVCCNIRMYLNWRFGGEKKKKIDDSIVRIVRLSTILIFILFFFVKFSIQTRS